MPVGQTHPVDQVDAGAQDVRDDLLEAEAEHQLAHLIRELLDPGQPPHGEGRGHDWPKRVVPAADGHILDDVHWVHEIVAVRREAHKEARAAAGHCVAVRGEAGPDVLGGERIAKGRADVAEFDRTGLAEGLRHPHRAPVRRFRGIDDLHRLDQRPAVVQVGGQDVHGEHDHAKVRSRDFDEQVRVAHLHFADVTAVDDGRERKHVPLGVAEQRHLVVSRQEPPVLLPLGVDLQDLPKAHRLAIAERT